MTEHNPNKARQAVGRRAMTAFERLNEMTSNVDRMDGIMKQASEWLRVDPETRCIAREVTALLYDALGDLTRPDKLDVWLVHGLFCGNEHAWLTIEGNPNEVNFSPSNSETTSFTVEEIAAANPHAVSRFIIDCFSTEAAPPVMLFLPESPFQLNYREMERFRRHPDPPVKSNYLYELSAENRAQLEELMSELQNGDQPTKERKVVEIGHD